MKRFDWMPSLELKPPLEPNVYEAGWDEGWYPLFDREFGLDPNYPDSPPGFRMEFVSALLSLSNEDSAWFDATGPRGLAVPIKERFYTHRGRT
jgi:hypothetical protein